MTLFLPFIVTLKNKLYNFIYDTTCTYSILYYTLSHPENDRCAIGYMLQDASFKHQSRCSFLNVWENTKVVSGIHADVTVVLEVRQSIDLYFTNMWHDVVHGGQREQIWNWGSDFRMAAATPCYSLRTRHTVTIIFNGISTEGVVSL